MGYKERRNAAQNKGKGDAETNRRPGYVLGVSFENINRSGEGKPSEPEKSQKNGY
jgi:hypothetical protein